MDILDSVKIFFIKLSIMKKLQIKQWMIKIPVFIVINELIR